MAKKRLKGKKILTKQTKTPSGRIAKRYERKPAGKSRCSGCGKVLMGISEIKGKRKVNRPYGGTLCSSCMRKKMAEKYIMG